MQEVATMVCSAAVRRRAKTSRRRRAGPAAEADAKLIKLPNGRAGGLYSHR